MLRIALVSTATSQHDGPASISISIEATLPWVPRLERELVERAQRGDEEAFHALVDSLGDRLFGLAHHILRDPHAAEDAAQEALVQMWRHLPRLHDPDSFGAWSHRIVVRAAYAEAARHRRWFVRPSFLGRPASEPDQTRAVSDRDQLDRGITHLSIEQRAVIGLKYFADRSDDQIAEILEIPVGTVRSRLHHSLRRLRAELDADSRDTGRSGSS